MNSNQKDLVAIRWGAGVSKSSGSSFTIDLFSRVMP